MNLKKKIKKNTFLPKLNKLLFLYFILTLVIVGFLLIIILTSDFFKREKVRQLNYLMREVGLNIYTYLKLHTVLLREFFIILKKLI